MICPICQAELDLVVCSIPSGSIAGLECSACRRYISTADGSTEVIKNQKGIWWIWINHDLGIIVLPSNEQYPWTPINYQNPQETIDRLASLKAFL